MKPSLVTTTALTAMLSAACGTNTGRLSVPAIYGGEPVNAGGYASTVGIALPDAGGLRLICTGVLVAPDVVLTAGHCVSDVADVSTLRLYSGDGVDGGLVASDVTVATIAIAPHFRRHPLGNADVAVLRLTKTLTGVQPAALSLDLDEDEALLRRGAELTLVGYGEREDRARGLKFAVTTPVKRHTSHEIVAGGGGRDACQGDSGGPVFGLTDTGGEQLVGLVSRGIGLGCGDGGYISRLVDHACWLSMNGVATAGTDPRLCPPATPVYAPKRLATVQFSSLCREARLSRAARHTMAAIISTLGAADCAEAAKLAPTVTKLNLDFRFISDLLPLAALPQLQELSLVGNRITDVASLRPLRALRTLDLVGNQITSIAPLASRQSTGLTVFGTRRQMDNFAATDFLRLCLATETPTTARLTIKAIFWKTMAEDCAVANERLLMLTNLTLNDRGLTDIGPLAGLQHLIRLDLAKNALTDVTPLAGLERLKNLDLRANPLTDLNPLGALISRGLVVLSSDN